MICNLIGFQALLPTCLFILAALIWHEEIDAASVQLTWADNSQHENGFDIERKAGTTGVFLALITVGANARSYTDTNLSSGPTYCYRVRALNRAGGSPHSNEACATTPANTISTNIANGATLSGSSVIWTAVPNSIPVRAEFFFDGTLGTTELAGARRTQVGSGLRKSASPRSRSGQGCRCTSLRAPTRPATTGQFFEPRAFAPTSFPLRI
jgi:hypothetical protein